MENHTETSAIFADLCARAGTVRRPRMVSPFIEAGQVAAAIRTDREKGSWITLAELTPDWWGAGRFESLDKTERSHENE